MIGFLPAMCAAGYPKLGIPVKGGRKKILLSYAWNESGEGGIVAPTRGDKEMKLEVLGVVEVADIRQQK